MTADIATDDAIHAVEPMCNSCAYQCPAMLCQSKRSPNYARPSHAPTWCREYLER